MSLRNLILLYSGFAAIATAANLAVQRIMLSISSSTTGFILAVLGGTAAGLVIKYILDKRWIFRDFSTGAASHGKKFPLYMAMGVVTTAIFWSMETGFWLLWRNQFMRELGAVLGLSIGYFIKYRLDRRFVFTDAECAPAAAR